MPEDSIQVTIALANGVRLTYPSRLESLVISTSAERLAYITSRLSPASIKIVLVPDTDGITLSDSKDDGSSQV